MAKTKGKVKLGVNVVENLLEECSYAKITSLLKNDKLSIEAAKFLLDQTGARFFFEVSSRFKFSDMFVSFEEYINSKLAKSLYDEGDSEIAFNWFDYFATSSEELLSLYNKQDTDYMKSLIFKNILYRTRIFRLSGEARQNYLNCFDAIFEITKERYSTSEEVLDTLAYVAVWSAAFSKEWAYKMQEMVGVQETVILMKKRLAKRIDRFNTKLGVMDIEAIYEYISEVSPNEAPIEELLQSICPTNIDYYLEEEETKKLYTAYREIYERHLSPLVKTSLNDIYRRVRGNYDKIQNTIYSFETDEKALDLVLSYTCKCSSPYSAISDIIYLSKRGISVHITDTMEKLSRLCSKSFSDVILTKPLTTAQEIIDFKNEAFPFSTDIDPFNSNAYATKNINLAALPMQELEKIAGYIRWDRIANYFEKDIVPFEFLMNNRHRINKSIKISTNMLKAYTSAQCVELVEVFSEYMDGHMLHNIGTICCHEIEGLTVENAARLLKKVPSLYFGCAGQGENLKIDLQSVLTLL